jgi:hypothetical protein
MKSPQSAMSAAYQEDRFIQILVIQSKTVTSPPQIAPNESVSPSPND